MILPLTSFTSLDTLATVSGTIVLLAILFEAWYSNYKDRRQKELEKREEATIRPHFSLFKIEHRIVEFEITKQTVVGTSTLNLPEKPSKIVRVGIVTAMVKNEGKMNAKRTRAFLRLSGKQAPELTQYLVWTRHGLQSPIRVKAPAFLHIENIEDTTEFLREYYFNQEMEMLELPPTVIGIVLLFFAVEASKSFSMPLAMPNSFTFLYEDGLELDLVPDDTPQTEILISHMVKFTDWKTFSYEPVNRTK